MAIIRVNPRLESELTHSLTNRGPMTSTLGEIADRVADRAKMIARREYYRRGGYARGIKSETSIDATAGLVGRVVATNWKSNWAENPPRQERGGRRGQILARAAQQAGLEVTGAALGGAVGAAIAGAISGGAGRRGLPAPRRGGALGRTPRQLTSR